MEKGIQFPFRFSVLRLRLFFFWWGYLFTFCGYLMVGIKYLFYLYGFYTKTSLSYEIYNGSNKNIYYICKNHKFQCNICGEIEWQYFEIKLPILIHFQNSNVVKVCVCVCVCVMYGVWLYTYADV